MEYTVKFNFNCINKRSMVSGKSGEVDITTEAKPEELKTSEELISLIATDMARKTKQSILSVEITDVRGKKLKFPIKFCR
jgi:hypothetical protein